MPFSIKLEHMPDSYF